MKATQTCVKRRIIHHIKVTQIPFHSLRLLQTFTAKPTSNPDIRFTNTFTYYVCTRIQYFFFEKKRSKIL